MTNSTFASPSISVESRNNELERLYPGFRPVTSDNKCPHCGKDHWCYFVGNLSVCKREFEPASGWYKTNKTDRDGTPFYAPLEPKQRLKQARPKQKLEFIHHSNLNSIEVKQNISGIYLAAKQKLIFYINSV